MLSLNSDGDIASDELLINIEAASSPAAVNFNHILDQ